MGIHQSITPSQMQMNEAHRARQARFAAAARNVKPAVVTKAIVDVKPIKARKIPMWQVIPSTFDHHVITYRHWRLALEMVYGMNEESADLAKFAIRQRKLVPQIVAEVLQDFPGITFEDLKGNRRNRKYVTPRHIAIYEVYCQRKDLSLPSIGRLFGNMDHTSIIFAVQKIRAQRAKEMEEKQEIA